METHEAVLAELEEMRAGAAALMRAKLEAMADQVRDHANRVAGDLGVVVPPDLEALFPLGSLAERLKALVAPPPPPPAPVAALDLETLRALDSGRAQSEVLQELLRRLAPWCGPRAIAVFRDGAVQGWSGDGFADANVVRTWRGATADSPALANAAAGTPTIVQPHADAVMSPWFAGSQASLLLVPMSLRGKIVGVLLALEGEAGLNAPMVQQLTYTVGLMLETLASRPTAPTPALAAAEVASAAPAVAIEAPMPAAEAPVPAAAVPPPMAAPEPPIVADASETVQLKVPVTPVSAAAPVRSPEDERKHDEARRFARLLVSEIRLYNEPAVQAGKLGHDIYARLKDDINRSREMYEQRVSPEVRAESNYFHDEMVRILADGDADALGV
jgi:hypothetical protein